MHFPPKCPHTFHKKHRNFNKKTPPLIPKRVAYRRLRSQTRPGSVSLCPAPATNSIEDVERALAHQLREEQWDSDWKSMTGKDDEFSEQELALCAFQRALQLEEPTFLPNVTTQERAHYIRTVLSRAPGIEHSHPVAANAIAQIEK